MAHSVSELQVITHAKNLCSYIFTITQKSPKQFRFSLIGRMQDYALNIVEELYYAMAIFSFSLPLLCVARFIDLIE